jgi:glycosyltransferase EpsD
MNKRCALIVACTAYHLDKFTWGQINILQKIGFEVHVAASFNAESSGNSSSEYINKCREKFINNNVKVHELPFTRFPVSRGNKKALGLLKTILGGNSYSLLHCHTPTGGLIARIAAKHRRKKGLKVIYTAHGFHFFKGAPLLNWLLYYPVERFLAKYTDKLIVINREDAQIVQKMPFKSVIHINGIGVSREPYKNTAPIDKVALGLHENAFIFLCVGELSKRKNQGLLIRAFARMAEQCPNAVLLLAGEGALREKYMQLSDSLNLSQKIFFLGWRDDIPALVLTADVVVSTAKQEGLPVNLVEAMIAGKSIIASPCRGNRELAEQAGIVADGEKEFSEAMVLLYENGGLREKFGKATRAAAERYEAQTINNMMKKIYLTLL